MDLAIKKLILLLSSRSPVVGPSHNDCPSLSLSSNLGSVNTLSWVVVVNTSVHLSARAVAEWVRALAWAGDRTVFRPGSNPTAAASLRNFGNSVYPALPVSFGGDTKSRRSLLSGVYARGSKNPTSPHRNV